MREPAALDGVERDLAYWRDRLNDAPVESTLTPDRPRPPVRGAHQDVVLPPDITDGLSRLARSCGVTLNAVLLAAVAAVAAVMHRFEGHRDVTLGMPTAGRPRTELESLIGSFAGVLVARIDLDADPTVRDLLTRTHRDFSV